MGWKVKQARSHICAFTQKHSALFCGFVVPFSIDFDVLVNVSNKGKGADVPNSAKHHKHDVAPEQCVAKELYCLQHPVHVRPVCEVENGVRKDKRSSCTLRRRL
eukprot:m.74198 g.74198  ORF g.74198 m.74198 type:complete len:104 (+) comp11794_c0_seq4:266-577(+)